MCYTFKEYRSRHTLDPSLGALCLNHTTVVFLNAAQIYDFARNAVNWPDYLYTEDMHFSVTGHAAECSDIRGGMIVSTRIKDAVCDDVRSKVRMFAIAAACSHFTVSALEQRVALEETPMGRVTGVLTFRMACPTQTGVKPVPAPKSQEPDVQLVAVAYRDTISIYRNMSGASLHRRG